MIISVLHKVENIVGKGENAGYQHFLLFPAMLSIGLELPQGQLTQDCVIKS